MQFWLFCFCFSFLVLFLQVEPLSWRAAEWVKKGWRPTPSPPSRPTPLLFRVDPWIKQSPSSSSRESVCSVALWWKCFPTAAPRGVCSHRRHTDTHCRGLGPTLSGCSVPSTALLHSFIFSFTLLKSEGYLMPCSCWDTRERKGETALMSLYNSNAENKCVWWYTCTKCT